jgi:hypothetical protein
MLCSTRLSPRWIEHSNFETSFHLSTSWKCSCHCTKKQSFIICIIFHKLMKDYEGEIFLASNANIYLTRFYRFWIELCIDGVCTWWFLVHMLIIPTIFWQKRIVYLYFFSTMYIWINKNMLILVWATTEWNVEWQTSLSEFLSAKLYVSYCNVHGIY